MIRPHKTASLVVQARVVGGLIMRELAALNGYTSFGLAGLILRPLFQLYLMFFLYLVIRGRVSLVGNDPYVFWGVTLLPFVLVIWPAAKVMSAISGNVSLLAFPIVTPFDLILSRSIVQILCSLWVLLIYFSSLYLFGIKIVPLRIEDAILATLSAVYFSFAFGWFSAVMMRMFTFWAVIKIVVSMAMYLTSGVFFLPESLPEKVQAFIVYNPLLHVVAWFRASYYEQFGYGLLDRTYLFSFATTLLFIGFFLERATRGWLMQK